jgi:hypothetical protein
MADYIPNDEAAAIADDLIQKHHTRLIGLKISHLLKLMPVPKQKKNAKPPRAGKKITLAKASKVSPKTNALADTDIRFVIEYGSMYWDRMDDNMKRALVDHELGHCGNDADGVYMVNHDIEDFGFMIERYGCWKKDVEEFVKTVLQVAAKQLDEAIAEHATETENETL